MKSHVESVARELLSAGWRPAAERCFVSTGDGTSPRLIDYEVWKTMRAIADAQKPESTKPPAER